MDREILKLEIKRLVDEAPLIAPSMVQFTECRNYGSVTDENLDTQKFVRWELEARAILQNLAASEIPIFKELYNECPKIEDYLKKYHSRSIIVHKTMEILMSADQILDSSLSINQTNDEEQNGLDPWPVIRGMLLELDSREVPAIIDRAGLPVDWNITEKENYSNSTRLAAYRARIDVAYRLLRSDNHLRVAYVVANGLIKRGMMDKLNEALNKIGWEVNIHGLTPSGAAVRQLFFPEQSQHDAYVEIRKIIQKATQSITVVDPYVDQTIFSLFSTCAMPITIRLLTSKVPKDFELEARQWLRQYSEGTIDIRTTKNFHDRFLVLDDTRCWHVGCSIKDAGNKAFMLSQVEDDNNRLALLDQINKSWASGTKVF